MILTIYPDSQPTNLELIKNGAIAKLMEAGVICREAICGPCTSVGEVPGNNEFSIRHNIRNFIYREGARPSDGQHAWVGLMDARSIAATGRSVGSFRPFSLSFITGWQLSANIFNSFHALLSQGGSDSQILSKMKILVFQLNKPLLKSGIVV